jgi:hypothetical protein
MTARVGVAASAIALIVSIAWDALKSKLLAQ